MVPQPRKRVHAFLIVALLGLVTLSGCLDDDEVDAASTDSDATGGEQATDPAEKTAGEKLDDLRKTEATNKTAERVPAAHYHHYWGDPALEEAFLFTGSVALEYESCAPDRFDQQQPPCMGVGEANIGSVTFTPEDDDDDVASNNDRAITANQKADTVLVGTSHLEVVISWDGDEPGDLLFFYKPANTPKFLPGREEDFIRVPNGGAFDIPLTQGMADPAHQIAVSRWAFRLVANGGPTINEQDWPLPFKYGAGEIDVQIVIKNGGEDAIDPPHPDPWNGRDTIRYVPATGDFQMARGTTHLYGEGYDDIAIPAIPKRTNIIPFGTDRIVVTAWVNTTNDAYDHVDWGLAWHGADTVVYSALGKGTAGEDGAMVFEIVLTDEQVETVPDPPYEKESYFRFGFYPLVADQADIGVIEASYTLSIQAYKDTSFSYYL